VGELWLDADSPALAPELEAALRRPPFDVLQKVSRRAYANEIEAEPIARGSLLMLVAAAVVAVALAVAGLALGVLTELRDERGELLDLEAQGAAPSALRRQLRLRALAVGVFGLVGGVLAGALLAALVVRLVALTASATEPEPPLVLSLGWSAVLAGLVLGGIAAAALVLTATARAFRSPAAARAGVSAP
jgi:ABC-type lipoprotein release transport system permease subunit